MLSSSKGNIDDANMTIYEVNKLRLKIHSHVVDGVTCITVYWH